jgi:hypothetical protein
MKINLQVFASPYMAFSLIWTAGILLYLLGWSDAFPTLSFGLLFFLLTNVILSSGISFWLNRSHYFDFRKITHFLNLRNLFLINLVLWLVNFAYSRVPLIEILTGTNYGYTDFGIPVVIVFITCYNSFLCLYAFHCYLSSKKKIYLIYYCLCMGLFILAYSRGLIMVTLVSTTFLWLAAKGGSIRLKQIVVLLVGLMAVLYAFGYAGNIRTAQAIARENNQSSYVYNNEFILEIASASPEFANNLVPNEFFWTYVYIASPISNLQYNVSLPHNKPYTGMKRFQKESVISFLQSSGKIRSSLLPI